MRKSLALERERKLTTVHNVFHLPPYAQFDYGDVVSLRVDVNETPLMVVGAELKPGSITYITSNGGERFYHSEVELKLNPYNGGNKLPVQVNGFKTR